MQNHNLQRMELSSETTSPFPDQATTTMESHGNSGNQESSSANSHNQGCIERTITEMEDQEWWEHLKFSTIDQTYEFYLNYAHKKGFGVRKDYKKQKKIKRGVLSDEYYWIRYLCNKEGRRQEKESIEPPADSQSKKKSRCEERTGCGAFISFHLSSDKTFYFINEWKLLHNHVLVGPDLSHMLRSNRKMNATQEQIANIHHDSGIRNRSSYEVMAMAAGGARNLGFLPIDLKNHLGRQRQKVMRQGEATALYEHFRKESYKSPSFYYEVQVDSEEQIAGIFWADKRMQLDYELFGDSIGFDTTYRTNNNYRPLGLFAGFNNHRMICIFGAALLYDETSESFQWLFRTFLNCMKNKAPKTIFTDQCRAIARGLAEEMKETYHALCTWHIVENAKKNLSRLCTSDVLKAFSYFINEADDEAEFDYFWDKMVRDHFPNGEHTWLTSIHEYRKQWSSVWVRKHFTAGMVSTQLVESCNSIVRGYLQCDLNLLEFFTHFNNMLASRRREESLAEFNAKTRLPNNRHKTNSLVLSAEVYTHRMFEKFQREYEESQRYQFIEVSTNGLPPGSASKYSVSMRLADSTQIDKRLVTIERNGPQFKCSCMLFESLGILCRHILKVMDTLSGFHGNEEFSKLPPHYILKRWTKNVKDGLEIPMDNSTPMDSYDQTFKHLTYNMGHLAALVSNDREAANIVDRNVKSMIQKFCHCRQLGTLTTEAIQDTNGASTSKLIGKKIKKRVNQRKSRARYKSLTELIQKKAKAKYDKERQAANDEVCNDDNIDQDTFCFDIEVNERNQMEFDLNQPPFEVI